LSTPCSPPTIPLPIRGIAAPPVPPFPRARFPGGVSGGPAAALVALLAGAAALSAMAAWGDGGWPEWWVPGALVLAAFAGYALLWAAVVAPVRRFATAMVRVLAENRADTAPRARTAEFDRVASALYRVSRIRPGRRNARSRRRVPMAVAPCVVLVLVLGWSIPAAVATVGGAAAQADTVVRQAGVGAGARADELRSALSAGLAVLQRAANPPTGAAVTEPGTTAAQVLAAEARFRSVSVLDRSGRAVATAGQPPSTTVTDPPREPRVLQANTAGSEPLVLAASPMWDGRTTLVAEFDPRALNDVIRAAGVRTRVVDPQRATVLDSTGYLAFAPLGDDALGELAATASASAPAVGTPESGRVAAAKRVSAPGEATDLGWVLVEDQNVVAAAFASDGSRRGTLVVIAVSASLAMAALAWIAITVVGPARRLARHVEQLAAGETVQPLAPQRHDEIGTAVAAINRFVAERVAAGAVIHQ
jgi:HAMP domain-containing protein